MYGIYCGVESRNIIKFNLKQNCLKINVNIVAELDRILTFARIFVNPSEVGFNHTGLKPCAFVMYNAYFAKAVGFNPPYINELSTTDYRLKIIWLITEH